MLTLEEIKSSNRFDVYDRHQDAETEIRIKTTNGATILIKEDVFRGVDVLVILPEDGAYGDTVGHIAFNDQYIKQGVRAYSRRPLNA